MNRILRYLTVMLWLFTGGLPTNAPFSLQLSPDTVWYVSPNGRDGFSCQSVTSPCKSIQAAINKASSGDTIFIASGVYPFTTGTGIVIDRNLVLSGGWDTTFTIQQGYATLDSNYQFRIMTVNNGVTASIERFIVTEGSSHFGGGLYLFSGSNLSLLNSFITGNEADWGAGMYIESGAQAFLLGTTLDANWAYVYGGAIYLIGELTIQNSVISNNQASRGGGIFLERYSSAEISLSTLTGNLAKDYAGAIYLDASLTISQSLLNKNISAREGGAIYVDDDGVLTLQNSTLGENRADAGGGIYAIGGDLFLDHDTFSANRARFWGGGTYFSISQVTMRNTIIANSIGAEDCSNNYSNFIANSHNLVEDGSCSGWKSGDPGLVKLAEVPGYPAYHPLMIGSPAIDAGDDATCLPRDQLGVARPRDGDGLGGAQCDIGAFEAPFLGNPIYLPLVVNSSPGALWTVNTLADELDGSCSDQDCSLRDAVQLSHNGDHIQFSVFGAINLTRGEFILDKQLVIDGSGGVPVIINCQDNSRAFYVGPAAELTLKHLQINHCQEISGGAIENDGTMQVDYLVFLNCRAQTIGGCIFNTGVLKVDHSTFQDSWSSSGGGGAIYNIGELQISNSSLIHNSGSYGGGIYNNYILQVENSTFDNNLASYGGGAITNYGFSGWMGEATILNSTFHKNSSSQYSGGIFNTGILTVKNSTFSGNNGSYGAGIMSNNQATIHNTIIANSLTLPDCSISGSSDLINNLVEDGSCSASLTGDPLLGVLQNNGGSTATFELLAGSPAIDSGSDLLCLPADQRGVLRPQDGNLDGTPVCDIGSFEKQ